MPYEIHAKGNFSEITEWLWVNVGKPVEFLAAPTATNNWQIVPIGLNNNVWLIRLWDHNKVLLCKLRWE